MSEWKECIEEGVITYVHEELGNVTKLADGVFIALYPKVVKLGPFSSAEKAQTILAKNRALVDQVLDELNHDLVDYEQELKEAKEEK